MIQFQKCQQLFSLSRSIFIDGGSLLVLILSLRFGGCKSFFSINTDLTLSLAFQSLLFFSFFLSLDFFLLFDGLNYRKKKIDSNPKLIACINFHGSFYGCFQKNPLYDSPRFLSFLV